MSENPEKHGPEDRGAFDFSETLAEFESLAREELASEALSETEIERVWQEIQEIKADVKEGQAIIERLLPMMDEGNKQLITFLFVEAMQNFIQYQPWYDQLKSRMLSAKDFLGKVQTAKVERKLLLGQLHRLEDMQSKA